MDSGVLQVLIGALISALLLWQGLVIRQFSLVVTKLEKAVDDIRLDIRDTSDRVIRLEEKLSHPCGPTSAGAGV